MAPSLISIVLVFFPLGLLVGNLTASPILGLMTATIAIMIWHKPEWVLLSLIALAPFNRSLNYNAIHPEMIAQAKAFVGLLLAGIFALRQMLFIKKNMFPPWLVAFLWSWLFLTVLASIHAVQPMMALTYSILALSGIALFWITFQLDRKSHRKILAVIILMAAAFSGLAVLQYLCGVFNLFPSLAPYIIGHGTQRWHQFASVSLDGAVMRISSVTQHPNQLGAYLSFLVPFACTPIMAKSLPRQTRWISAAILGLLFLGIFTTNSRAAFLITAGSLFYLGIHRNYRWLLALGFGGLVTGFIIYSLSTNPGAIEERFLKIARISSAKTAQRFDTLSGRTTVWKNALELVKQSPILGVGPGNLPYETVQHFGFFIPNIHLNLWEQVSDIHQMGEKIYFQFHAHNLYLQLVGEEGIFALFLFLAGLVAVIVHCERRERKLPAESLYRSIALGTASGAIGLAVFGCFDSHVMFTHGSLNLVAGPLLAIGLRT